ncbi:hypothetical protein O181_089467 [Austropuccinia psidii MF-1]|uniref:CCHC-type domain-containing protein n=1 Tax=Austropuccinia psidii MF-1 TaxID=1389203 RepID=A0A9Q3ITM2_9BASI|nr:hypothetical protein [Austropuccinia psidii MF-1]
MPQRFHLGRRIRKSIGRYKTHSTGDNMENPSLETKEAHDSEELKKTKTCHNCRAPNHYAESCPKYRKEIFSREEETTKDQEAYESDYDSVRNGCGNDSYSESTPIEKY